MHVIKLFIKQFSPVILSVLNILHSVIQFIFRLLVSQIITTVKDANSTCNSINLIIYFTLFIK